jgi:group I intron endonuclease
MKLNNKKHFIYGLICPLNNNIRYVGQTVDIKRRLTSHINKTKNKIGKKTKKEEWILELINLGLEKQIKITIIEECDSLNVDEREIYYINKYRLLYENITNTLNGGSGEFKEYIFKKRKPHNEESKKKISEANKGEKNGMYGRHEKRDQKWCDAIKNGLNNSEKLKNSRKSEEYREKLSNIQSQKLYILDSITFKIEGEFKNSKYAAEFFNFTRSNIKNARRYKRIIGKSLKQKFYVIYESDYIKFKDNLNEYFN